MVCGENTSLEGKGGLQQTHGHNTQTEHSFIHSSPVGDTVDKVRRTLGQEGVEGGVKVEFVKEWVGRVCGRACCEFSAARQQLTDR